MQQQALEEADELRKEAELQVLVQQQEAANAAEAVATELRHEHETALRAATEEMQQRAMLRRRSAL